MGATPSIPSLCGRPPQPPKKISITANGVPSSFSPVKCNTSPPSPGIGTRSGSAFARARNNISKTRKNKGARPPTAAGKRGFTKLPAGAMTCIGRINPTLVKTSGLTILLTAPYTVASVILSGRLIAPRACGPVPVKSTLRVSPAACKVTLSGRATPSEPKPSSSKASSCTYSPTGISLMAARVAFSA